MKLDKLLLEDIQNLTAKYGKDYIRIITSLLLDAGKESSGQLINSFQTDLKIISEQINVVISSEDYLKYVDEGRLPGTWPNIGAIEDWVSLKGIPEEAVFPIARKIFRFGIEPTHILDRAITDIESFTADKLEDDVIKDIEERITKQINEIKI